METPYSAELCYSVAAIMQIPRLNYTIQFTLFFGNT